MAVKHKNLFLYLTLACFLGIILIFIFDGYMGVYDTITVKSGEYEQKMEADFWLQPYNQASASVERSGKVFFRYEVDNRQFSEYAADVEVSVWHSQEKVRDVMAQPMSIARFAKGQLDWTVDTAELLPGNTPPEQGYQYTVIIKRGGVERKVILFISPGPYPPKVAIPAPIR
jgi:hypothetical protein